MHRACRNEDCTNEGGLKCEDESYYDEELRQAKRNVPLLIYSTIKVSTQPTGFLKLGAIFKNVIVKSLVLINVCSQRTSNVEEYEIVTYYFPSIN